jgi:hypothetical protein
MTPHTFFRRIQQDIAGVHADPTLSPEGFLLSQRDLRRIRRECDAAVVRLLIARGWHPPSKSNGIKATLIKRFPNGDVAHLSKAGARLAEVAECKYLLGK